MTDPNEKPALRLHHVGFVVRTLEEGRLWFSGLGLTDVGEVFNDPVQRVAVQFIRPGATVEIELIEPSDSDSPVSRFLDKQGPGLNHLCYEVDDLDSACADFRQQGAIITCEPVPAVAFSGRRVAFLYQGGQLFELVESESATLGS